MFWKFNNISSSQIEAVLAKEDVTLKELMDEEDIINECKLQNKTLVEFLTKPNVIDELVTLTTFEPLASVDEEVRFKYSNIACEILTSDVAALNEQIASSEVLLTKLYQFMNVEPPLNPLLASFFSKIMGALIAKKTEQNWLSYQVTCLQVLDFLKAKDDFITNLLKHLGTSAIMDLTLKLLTQVEGVEMRQNVLSWLSRQEFMQSLVALLSPSIDSERHYNVAQLLCDFVKITRDNLRNNQERNEPDLLLNTLEAPETIALLLNYMLSEPKSESCIVGGIQVLLTILDANKNSCDEINEAELNQPVIETTTLAVLNRLGDFHALLKDPPNKASVSTTIGTLNPPLGNTRIHIVKLLSAIISRNNPKFLKEIISLGTTQLLLDLFFDFPWNNFLHQQVEAFINYALKAQVPCETGDDSALYDHLIINCKLVERVLSAWKDNETDQLENKCARKGYMGHLTNIALNVAELYTTSPLGQFLKDNLPDIADAFSKFNENTLSEIRNTHEKLLGGANPNLPSEDTDEYGDVPLNQANLLHQQMYAQFQLHQVTPQVVDFNYDDLYDPDFIDGDDALQTIDHRTGMNFDLSEGDLVQQHELFKQVCAQNINTLDDADDHIFEDRDNTYQTIIEKQASSTKAVVYSSDSEEDDSPPLDDPFVTVDPWPSANCNDSTAVVIDPWSIKDKDSEEGWANFNSFADFELHFDAFGKPTVESDLTVENVEEFNNRKVGEVNSVDAVVANLAKFKVESPQGEVTSLTSADEEKVQKGRTTDTTNRLIDVTEAATPTKEK